MSVATIKRHTVANALRIAAVQYLADAATFKIYADGDAPQFRRTQEAFEAQAREATALADEIEQADCLYLAD